MIPLELKQNIVKLAIIEGKLKLEGNQLKGGKEIEKYLAPFRALFVKHNSLYTNLKQGFQWCCAYVYYILSQAGYNISIQPFEHSSTHLGSVRAWIDWGTQENKLYKSWQDIAVGDIVIFNHLMDNPLDHIGIVVEVHKDYLLCSEGNFYNKSGIFKRMKDEKIWGYIRCYKHI